MAPTTYTVAELKALVLGQINKIKGIAAVFANPDDDQSYDEAVRECGFEIPATDDDDLTIKYQWLIQRMRRWYIGQLYVQYVLQFEAGDLKAQQIVRNLERMLKTMDEQFGAAKADADLAHIFYNAATYFGTDLVQDSGFVTDRIGQDTSSYE